MNASRSPLQSNLLPEDDTVVGISFPLAHASHSEPSDTDPCPFSNTQLPLVIIGAGPQAAMLLSYLNSPFQQVTGDDERVFQRYQDWMARKAKTSAAPAQQLFQTPPVVSSTRLCVCALFCAILYYTVCSYASYRALVRLFTARSCDYAPPRSPQLSHSVISLIRIKRTLTPILSCTPLGY